MNRDFKDLLSEFSAKGVELPIKTFDGLSAGVISVDDLIANKKASGRLQDLADVEALQKLSNRADSGLGDRNGGRPRVRVGLDRAFGAAMLEPRLAWIRSLGFRNEALVTELATPAAPLEALRFDWQQCEAKDVARVVAAGLPSPGRPIALTSKRRRRTSPG